MRKLLSLVIASAMLVAFAGTALAADDTSVTEVEVLSQITIVAPALIDFGSGLPGAALEANGIELLVTTNNETGYVVTIGTPTAMASTGTSTDVQSAPTFAFDGASTSAERSAEAGDTITVDGDLTVDFVDAGVYTGSVTFTAVTQ